MQQKFWNFRGIAFLTLLFTGIAVLPVYAAGSDEKEKKEEKPPAQSKPAPPKEQPAPHPNQQPQPSQQPHPNQQPQPSQQPHPNQQPGPSQQPNPAASQQNRPAPNAAPAQSPSPAHMQQQQQRPAGAGFNAQPNNGTPANTSAQPAPGSGNRQNGENGSQQPWNGQHNAQQAGQGNPGGNQNNAQYNNQNNHSGQPGNAPGGQPNRPFQPGNENVHVNGAAQGQQNPGFNRPGNGQPDGGRVQSFAAAHANLPHNAALATLPARGSVEHNMPGGGAYRLRPDGHVSDFHDARRGVDIHINVFGGRSFVATHPDHSMTYFEAGRPGWVQHPYHFQGADFARRTYVFEGHVYSSFFRVYLYRGRPMQLYAPPVYYTPGFYGWFFRPWYHPVVFGWGWRSDPWYHQYSYYYTPSPSYQSPNAWLADYLIASDLQEGYRAQIAAHQQFMPPPPGEDIMLSPSVKQRVADEVQIQLEMERQQAQSGIVDPETTGIGAELNDVANGRLHVFVVSGAQDAVDNYGNECGLSDGDVLEMRYAPDPDSVAADLTVLASKGGMECRRGVTVALTLDSLQEMLNQMRATIDRGLQTMNQQQGQGGLPPLPPGAAAAQASYAAAAPPEDPAAANELQQQAQQADQLASQELAQVQPQGNAPPTIAIGQNIVDVERIMGQPKSRALVGNKTIYNYDDMKVTFLNGVVTNVE
jgi:hypothetical protein